MTRAALDLMSRLESTGNLSLPGLEVRKISDEWTSTKEQSDKIGWFWFIGLPTGLGIFFLILWLSGKL